MTDTPTEGYTHMDMTFSSRYAQVTENVLLDKLNRIAINPPVGPEPRPVDFWLALTKYSLDCVGP
jgi:hypothetical protein